MTTVNYRTIRLYEPKDNPISEAGQPPMWLAASEDMDGRPISRDGRSAELALANLAEAIGW